ncbi:hypothetical protein F5B20DRAFT_581798 [Whalleya microplaca]|nr:hypothetical protein F5B20DRAFT_581798 [Whalleya microplaca]
MAHPGQGEDRTSTTAPRSPSPDPQQASKSADSSTCSRLDDFLKESHEDGNRHVLLPDQSTNGEAISQKARERMSQQLQDITEVLEKSEG